MTTGPISDMLSYFDAIKEPVTEAGVYRLAKMLSMTEGELALALTLVRTEARKNANPPQYTDAEFMAWAESYKPCKRCNRKFYGPVCECETGS